MVRYDRSRAVRSQTQRRADDRALVDYVQSLLDLGEKVLSRTALARVLNDIMKEKED